MRESSNGCIPEWTVGDRIRKALDIAHIEVQDMAEYLGLSKGTLGGYINDHRKRGVPLPVLRVISQRTDVSLEWLLNGDGQPDADDCGG